MARKRWTLAVAVLLAVGLVALALGVGRAARQEKLDHQIDSLRAQAAAQMTDGQFAQAADTFERLQGLFMDAGFYIKETLPKAWSQIMSDPKKWLADILGSVTEELCGYHPEREVIEGFISSQFKEKVDLESLVHPKPAAPPQPPAHPQPAKVSIRADDYTWKSILSFSLKGTRYEVKSWKAMFIRFCEVVLPRHKDDLDVLFTLSKPGKDYFSKNPYQLLTCEKIAGTGMYVDVNLTAREVVDLSQKMLHLLGYDENSLAFQVS